MFIRKGVKLLEEKQGDGDLVQRQHTYVLSIRFTLNQGEILAAPPWHPWMDSSQSDGFFDHHVRVDREQLIPGLFYAVGGMRIGGYRKVTISPHLAYGEKGVPDQIPPNAKLTAEIKVVSESSPGGTEWSRPEISEPGMLTQHAVCQRYQITRLTLWRWRRAGRIPAPLVSGRTIRWKQLTLEQWETEGRPRVSPSLDEAEGRIAQALARIKSLVFGGLDSDESNPVELSPTEQDEVTRMLQEINQIGDQMLDLRMELALLIDEAGQWDGPPLEKFVQDRDAAAHHSHNMAQILKKLLAAPES